MPIRINAPDAPDFEPSIDLKDLMGTWYVTHSTLPMWKSKKDVTITYTPVTGDVARFDDVVEYRSARAPPTAPRSRIVGVDALVTGPARFKWRGRGWLAPITSRWQLLGVSSASGKDGTAEPAWAVTFFERTLFTPMGIDIYARSGAGLPPALVEEIKEGLRAASGDVGRLSGELFEVEHSPLGAEGAGP
ncbi:hypothetical protein K488DRAFT_53496 [Vararia minispora EC-137]|uniref:Uncharacterized protein n=1 Tax=Vararia minispora EC-137 TaxID=1314806 RepID=A0ACB8QG90_9AGAM|nr:hypothetical protein K488DRAFT_53496 [Vararia minispora EC-137]